MRKKTAKLLRAAAPAMTPPGSGGWLIRAAYRKLKRNWNKIPRPLRAEAKEQLQ